MSQNYNRFTKGIIKTFLLVSFLLPGLTNLFSQAHLEVTITGGSSTTTCGDPIGSPEPRFRVNIEATGWEVYPATAFCFNDFPNIQYEAYFDCPDDVPAFISVCLEVFEDDGSFCTISRDCEELACENFALPAPGTNIDYVLEIPDGLASDGEVEFNIALNNNFIGGQNDLICNAIDLGTIPFSGQVGDGSLSAYNNFCATNTNEPNPGDEGGFGNDRAVWFSFTTDANPSAYAFINGFSDPQNLGDEVGLQIAVYESSDNTCNGNLSLFDYDHDNSSLDQTLRLTCLQPNSTYFIMVDAAYLPSQNVGMEGYFGLEIVTSGIIAAADFRCNAEDLGMVPDGGSVGTPTNQTNICATDIGEANPSAFELQRAVWYEFQAPNTGHVIIDIISDQNPPAGLDPVDTQLGLYRSGSGSCFGPMIELESQYSSATYDESMDMKCLTPGESYWIIIDGSGNNTAGIFSVTITDGGPVPPQSETVLDEVVCDGQTLVVAGNTYDTSGPIYEIITLPNGCDSLITGQLTVLDPITSTNDVTICNGESITIGSSVYFDSGSYQDVLTTPQGCDSLVNTNLTVLESVEAVAIQLQEASSQAASDGSATVNINVGPAPYSYLWSNGATTQTINNLSPDLYCVTVTAANGCEDISCISILYPGAINVNVIDGSVTCNGGDDGTLTIIVNDGTPDYNYEWGENFGPAQGSGTITTMGGSATISGLSPGSNYTITITDADGVIVVTSGEIIEPNPIVNNLDATICFGETLTVGSTVYDTEGPIMENLVSPEGCDSLVTGTLTILDEIETNLDLTECFGTTVTIGNTAYNATGPINETLQAANGCDSLVTGFLTILPEISSNLDTSVCFGESITVGTSVYSSSGMYTDILTAANGCDSTVFTEFMVLDELTVDADLVTQASAYGASDGLAEANVNGGAGGYTYIWSNNWNTQQAGGLQGGETYCVTVTDAAGCTAEDCVIIYFPVNILSLFANDTLDCANNTNGELIFTAYNGEAPYNYTWQNSGNTLNGNGVINTEGGLATISNLPPDIYTIIISDIWGDFSFQVEIVEPEPVIVNLADQADASCFGDCDGNITVTVNGGTAPYQYSWSGGATGDDFVDLLCAGNYTLTVTDSKGCTTEFTADVGEPEEFIIEAIELNPVACNGGNNGEATVITNGTPIAFLWDNNETTEMISGLTAGEYFVTVTNIDNCTAEASVLITQPLSSISAVISIESEINCHDSNDGIASVTAAGGSGYTYLWSNGDTGEIAVNLSEGIYYVSVLDENGCEAFDSIQLMAPEPIEAELSTVDVNCPDGDFSGMVFIDSAFGGNPSYLYSIDGLNFSAVPQIDNLAAGTYDLMVEDANGCIESFPFVIGAPPEIIVDLGGDVTIDLGESIMLEAITNSFNPVFQWQSSDSLSCDNCEEIEVMPLDETLYEINVIDTVSGCTAVDRVMVTVKKTRPVFIPNIFSPNGDGSNDVFMIYSGPAVAKINTFQIFNRWGAVMYSVNDFLPNDSHGWNGMYKGEVLDNGVYVYYAEIEFIDGRVQLYKGDVTLVK